MAATDGNFSPDGESEGSPETRVAVTGSGCLGDTKGAGWGESEPMGRTKEGVGRIESTS